MYSHPKVIRKQVKIRDLCGNVFESLEAARAFYGSLEGILLFIAEEPGYQYA